MVDLRDDSHGSVAVAPDDLNAPLGLGKGKRLPKLPVSPPQILAGALGLSGLVVVVAWATFVHDPLGGQPVAVVATKLSLPAQSEQNGSTNPPAAHEAAANTPDAAKAIAPPPPGSKTVTIIDGSSGARQQVVIPDNSARTRASHCSIPSCWRQHGTARFRKSDRTVRARRCVTRSRAISRRIKKTHRLWRS